MPARVQKHTRPVETGPGPDQTGMERLIFFSDAVFAIAITLLVLEIRLPATSTSLTDSQLTQSLLAIWPKYMAYAISFLVIGLFWFKHHRRFRLIQRYDTRLIFLNLLLLMGIGFIPFPTSVMSDYGDRTSTIFYALTIIVTGFISIAIWLYASHNNRLIDPLLSQRERRRELGVPLAVMGVFALSIGLAFIDPGIARFSWILVVVIQAIFQ